MDAQTNATTPPPPPTRRQARRAGPRISVWLLADEKEAIQAKAAAHSLSDSAYLRALGLGMPVRSTLDQEAVLELARINGDLGRLGGLLKMWLANEDRAMNEERIASLVGQIEQTQSLLYEKVQGLAHKGARENPPV